MSSLRISGDLNLTYGLVESLGRSIVAGKFDSKSFPTEGELASQHGTSRSVTREAVKMLTAKGLLRARPRQGTSVTLSRTGICSTRMCCGGCSSASSHCRC